MKRPDSHIPKAECGAPAFVKDLDLSHPATRNILTPLGDSGLNPSRAEAFMRVRAGLKSCLLLVFLSAFGQIAKAVDLAPGNYRVASAMHDDQARCIDKKTQDNYSIQMFPCNAGPEQVFTVSGAPDGNFYIYDYNSHALGLSAQSDSAKYLVNIVVSTGTPETPNIQPATWQFQRNTGDGNFAI